LANTPLFFISPRRSLLFGIIGSPLLEHAGTSLQETGVENVRLELRSAHFPAENVSDRE
jgi:hypothetical protein